MPVIINDFEILVEAPPPADPAAATDNAPQPAVMPNPEQIAAIMRWHTERAERTRSR